MKKILALALAVVFSLPLFAKDFYQSYKDLYASGFSINGMEKFHGELLELEKQADTLVVLQENQEAMDAFQKMKGYAIAGSSQMPMSPEQTREFMLCAATFLNSFASSRVFGEKLLLSTCVGFCVLVLIMIFLLRYAMNKEEKYRKLKNLSEITKAVEEATIQTQDRERKALYQTLHDTVSQNIKAEQIFAEKLKPYIAPELAALELYDSILKIQKENLAGVRNILDSYSSGAQKDFCQNVAELCAAIKNSTKLDIKLLVQNQESFESAGPKEKDNIYNIIKEAASNAFRHANCESVSVILRADFNAGRKSLLIIDDGAGFDPSLVDKRAHHGLEIVKNRAALVGGTCDIKSAPGNGTEICVEWPL